jgi:hypothetical protein
MKGDPSRHYAPWLWLLLALFVGRVVGQLLVAYTAATWLPPMPEWYSGLLPYSLLLPAQVLIIGLLAKICIDVSRGRGFFVEPRPVFGRPVLLFGYLYLAVMVIRYPIRMYLHPEARWFGQTIPIFFHWILATYVILFGHYHRSQLRSLDPDVRAQV